MIKLHPNAATALNDIASTISSSNKLIQREKSEERPWGDSHISAAFTDKDIIGSPRMFIVGGNGDKIGFSTHLGGEPLSIEGEDFAKVLKLIQRVLGISTLKHLLSEEYVEEIAIDWCIENSRTRSQPFSEYLLSRVKNDVAYHQIWVPVSSLQVQEDFQFGMSRIITIGRGFFDKAESSALEARPGDREAINGFYNKMRRELQGNAAVAVSVKGEPKFASKQAQIDAEAAVGLLRFFHFAALTSKIFCPTALLGSEFTPQIHGLTISGIDRFQYARSIKHKNEHAWRLSTSELSEMRRNNLDLAATLISDDGHSDFADRVRSSLLTYSKGITFPDLSDRLVYSLSALEGLFLKDASEPISQNLAERVAFSTSRDTDERIAIVKNFRTVYAARSQYIHHRQNKALPDDALERFFCAAWAALATALGNVQKYSTAAEFIEVIDRMKFS